MQRYVCGNSAEIECIGIYVVPERKKHFDAFGQTSRISNQMADRHFWARGYYVLTVGNVNEETIIKYLQEQEKNDKLEDGRK